MQAMEFCFDFVKIPQTLLSQLLFLLILQKFPIFS